MAVHQGFYDFLAYATPEGSQSAHSAPLACTTATTCRRDRRRSTARASNKFGINYGGGVKIRLRGPLGVRFDVHQFTNGKPFGLGGSGWIRQTEISAGVAWML